MHCDKCGQEVEPGNDASVIAAKAMAMASGEKWFLTSIVTKNSRHFLPVKDGTGKEICPGSPSRFQYLEGQPRDPRPGAEYVPDLEIPYRTAFREVQK